MPMGILGVVSMPFGFDGVFWHLMGEDIDWMVWVAQWVGNLPRAVGRMRAFGTGPLLAGTADLPPACAVAFGRGGNVGRRQPLGHRIAAARCVLVTDDGQTAAIRGPDGRLSILRSSRDSFAVKESPTRMRERRKTPA
jgi:competence protein ComEC